MSSVIVEIYALLDAMTVSYTDKDGATATATCYSIGENLPNINTADLPCRILIMPTSSVTLGPGPMANGSYAITDLFLLDTVGQDMGQKIQWPVLLRYMKAYQDAIANKWNWQSTWQNEAFTVKVDLTPGKYNYPADSDVWFYGVKCDITIEEIF